MQKLQAYRHTDPVPSSAVVWRGRSAFTSSPIVAIVTGMGTKSKNAKTGANLAQLWILAEGISPLDAIRTNFAITSDSESGLAGEPFGAMHVTLIGLPPGGVTESVLL